MTPTSPLADLLRGDARALARAISVLERGGPDADTLSSAARRATRQALVIGITGPPGVGKSTLIGRLVDVYRAAGRPVAVLAVDPTSPFTGGAILGDRVRMQHHAVDQGVFIRSLATRGATGGVSAITADAVVLAAAAGFDLVVLETTGVGQGEVDVARLADVTVVLAMPGAGDDLQALKAGVMEIADIFVVHKADREGADAAAHAIESALALREDAGRAGRPSVLRVSSATGAGLTQLTEAIARAAGETDRVALRRQQRTAWRLEESMRSLAAALVRSARDSGTWDQMVERVARGEIGPGQAAAELMGQPAESGARLDHVAIAVSDPGTVREFLTRHLGLSIDAGETVVEQAVEVWFLGSGQTRVEVVRPTHDQSPVASFLASRGPGLHHLAFVVDDLPRALSTLAAAGVRLIDQSPRPGAHGRLVAFVHPSSTGGVLVELVSRAGEV